MSPTISSLGERALVARLQRRVAPAPAFVQIGIGDDAAVLRPARNMDEVITTDSLVEGVHFRREWSPAESIGYKALAVNLSDLASMGAAPRASLLSLALPADFPLDDFDALLDGYLGLATTSGAYLVGGNMTRSPGPVVIDVTAIGTVGHRRALRREGARRGDELYVTGTLGSAAAALGMLQSGRSRHDVQTAAGDCLARYERPEPRLRFGGIVGRSRAAAAGIDLSDGLADAASRLASAAGLGVVIDAGALPMLETAASWAQSAGRDPVELAVTGGEDYELAFAVSPRRRSRLIAAARRCSSLPMTKVGTFVAEPGVWLERDGQRGSLPEGFSHF
ncbi:MAG: thiamine-phosphate kinase [Acidobacteriota bacterium]